MLTTSSAAGAAGNIGCNLDKGLHKIKCIKNNKQVLLPPREFLLPPILLLYVLLLLLVVGEVGVLATAVGLNSSASGFSLDVLRVLCKGEECVICRYGCIGSVTYCSTPVDETSSTREQRKTFRL